MFGISGATVVVVALAPAAALVVGVDPEAEELVGGATGDVVVVAPVVGVVCAGTDDGTTDAVVVGATAVVGASVAGGKRVGGTLDGVVDGAGWLELVVVSSSASRTTAVVMPAASSSRMMTKRLARMARFMAGGNQSRGGAVTLRPGGGAIYDSGEGVGQ